MANRNPPKTGQFKKGQSGNPKGRPKLPEDLVAVKRLASAEVQTMIAKFSRMNVGQLKELVKDDSISGLERAIIMNIMDPLRMDYILSRCIGKVPDIVESTNTNINMDYDPEEYAEVPKEALIKLVSNS